MITKIKITGMHCQSCANLIKDVCSDVKGIKSCSIDAETGEGEVEHGGPADLDELKKEIEKLGQGYKIQIHN